MEINERIKILRKELKISQEEFGKKLNLKKSAISKYEKGINKVNDRTIINICREFKVNEEWLRFGEGKIFQEVPESTIKRLIKEYNLNDTQSKLIIEFLNLNESEREVLAKYITNLSRKDRELEQEVENYRKELLAEQKEKILSASEDIKDLKKIK
ncbi:MAG: helix-turn-helix domain-containing protein [Clostridium sp.]|nr:helix-turn-helix domain-containing protein [Clostridium sp.]